jgi:glyoxylase-like metal-dependent hydrolase (beta-lactamase superfamily II)
MILRGRRTFTFSVALAFLAALFACSTTSPGAGGGVQRLYVLYCGEAHIPDISPWSPGVDVGQPAVFSDNCYLIHHGKDWMLWDSGYADSLAGKPDGIAGPRGMRAFRTKTLVSQMAEIGVTPAQVTIVAFSHTHGDHVGNANLFTTATVYMQRAEFDAAFGPDPAKYGFMPTLYDKLSPDKIVKLAGDFDVFGDGSVKILSTPGHTPGHQSLLVHLPQTGAIVLSGDIAHFEEKFTNRRVPGFNFNLEQSRQSMDRIAAVMVAEHAQLWINHDSAQNTTIVHAPQYYE